MKGLDQFKHASIQTLPVGLRGAVQAGWYEGSVFFGIMGMLYFSLSIHIYIYIYIYICVCTCVLEWMARERGFGG
jgi:hypothetical protein